MVRRRNFWLALSESSWKITYREKSAKLCAPYLLRYGHKTEVLKGDSTHPALNDAAGVTLKEKSINIFVGSYVFDYLSK